MFHRVRFFDKNFRLTVQFLTNIRVEIQVSIFSFMKHTNQVGIKKGGLHKDETIFFMYKPCPTVDRIIRYL